MNNPLSPDAKIIYYEALDSTMLEARRMTKQSSKKAISGTVIVANYQTNGRGRISDRRWLAKQGEGLLFTIIFSCKELQKRMKGKPFSLLPLLCGLAVASAVETIVKSHDIKIKWPNDVLVEGKKLCGILCEKTANHFFIGIGLNLNQNNFPENLKDKACSIKTLTGKKISPEEFLQNILGNLLLSLATPLWKQKIEKRLFLKNKTVQVSVGLADRQDIENKIVKGRLAGIDISGALIIETSVEKVFVTTGELKLE